MKRNGLKQISITLNHLHRPIMEDLKRAGFGVTKSDSDLISQIMLLVHTLFTERINGKLKLCYLIDAKRLDEPNINFSDCLVTFNYVHRAWLKGNINMPLMPSGNLSEIKRH